MELHEKAIWKGLAAPKMTAFHLYTNSYLEPEAEWGIYDNEKSMSKKMFLVVKTSTEDIAIL